jgi:NAD(P)H dehydrogenase (quinone)
MVQSGNFMHVLVVYYSKTGNTEKMALAIAEGVKGARVDVIVKKANETANEDLLEADGIIIGSPTYYGQMASEVKAIFDRSVKIHGKLEGKVGAAFTSSGGTACGAETTILSILKAMLVHGMIIQGRANIQHYGSAAVGEPKKQDEEKCRQSGKRVADLVLKLKR